MSDLEAYLNDSSRRFPNVISNGIPSEWMRVGELTIKSEAIWFGDPFVANAEDGLLARTPNGTYLVEAQGFDFNGYRVIGRLRARLNNTENLSLGSEMGKTGTDSGLIAVCDITKMDAAIAGESDKFQDVIDNFQFNRFGILEFEMSGDIKIVYVNSGFGDGTGPVFELRDENSDRVGFELDFIDTKS